MCSMKLRVSAYLFILLCLNAGCSQRVAEYLCTEGRHTTDPSYPKLVDQRLVIDYENSTVVLCYLGSDMPWCRPVENAVFAADLLFFEEGAGEHEYSFNASTRNLTYSVNFSIHQWSCERV